MTVFATGAFAAVTADFEPTGNGLLSVRDELKQQNWHFPEFDMNSPDVQPISGLGSMVCSATISPTQTSGVLTPFLHFGSSEVVSFNYNLSREFSPTSRRWFLVYLVDSFSNLTLVDSIEITSSTTTVNYSKTINNNAGTYGIYVNVRGMGSVSRFIMDDFYFSGSLEVGSSGLVMAPNSGTDPKGTGSLFNSNPVGNPSTGTGSILDKNRLNITPNPAKDNINLLVVSTSDQEGELSIYNVQGARLIFQPSVTLAKGNNNLNINIGDLVPGNYFVSIKSGDQLTTQRLIRIQ
jgi:hypothetical protein